MNAYMPIKDMPPREQTTMTAGRLASNTNIVIRESCMSDDHQRGRREDDGDVSRELIGRVHRQAASHGVSMRGWKMEKWNNGKEKKIDVKK
jgi:hypothetical protein